MNFTVVWLPDAEDELAAVWLASSRRNAVTQASDELDRRLAANAPGEGESRPDGRRIAFAPPVGIIFRVYPDTATVIVSRVWEFH